MEILKNIYRPLLYARYAGFVKFRKDESQEPDIKEEYSTISMLNVLAPAWTEVAIILMFTGGIKNQAGILLVTGLLFLFNWIVSRIIISKLKKEDFYHTVMAEYSANESISKKYENLWINTLTPGLYAFAPTLPIFIYFLIR